MQLLFSHGSIQFPHVQKEFFGRLLDLKKQTIYGYKLGMLKIINPEVIAVLENNTHSIAMSSNNPEDEINGFVFEITEDELKTLDTCMFKYKNCERVKITLTTNEDCWLYITNKTPII